MPPGLDRRSDTAYVLNAGRPLRPPCLQELFDTRALDVFEAFVEMDPTLMPPKASLQGALLLAQHEVGGVIAAGDVNVQAKMVVTLLKLIVSRFRELKTNAERRKALLKCATVAHREMIHKVVSRIVVEQVGWTPDSRHLSTSSSASSSHGSRVDASRFDDDSALEAELASLEEDLAWPTCREVVHEDALDAEIAELEKESGIPPSPRS